MNRGLIAAGRAAADDLLGGVFGFPIVKAKAPDPLTPGGFDALVLDLLVEIQKVAYGPEKEALDKALEELDQDWHKMTKTQRSNAIAIAANKFLGLTKTIAPKVGNVVQAKGKALITGTKAAAAKKYKLSIEPNFSAIDETIINAVATHQAHFIRDQYGVRSVQFSKIARDVVASGLEEGLDRYKIAEELGKTLNTTIAARSDGYWQLIASVFTSRSITFGALSSFTEAGIESFTFEAVLDEVTTEMCRFMHGKTFSVKAGMQRYEEVAAAPDPEMVKELQPWAAVGKTEDGGTALFYKSGGERKPIAAIDSPAYGQKDKVGTYSKAMSPAALQAAGLSCPPLHGHCRSTIVPGDGPAPAVSVPAAVPTPATPIPVAPLPQPGPPPAPVVLPANLAELVRPIDTRTVDNETLPALTAAEEAALAAKKHQEKILEALENALDYGPVKQAPASAGYPGYVLHGLQSLPEDEDGLPKEPWDSKAITPSKLAGAKKQNPTLIEISQVTVGSALVNGKAMAAAIKAGKLKNPDPNDVVLVKIGGKLYTRDVDSERLIVAAHLTGKTVLPGKVIDLDKFAAQEAKKKPKTVAAAAAAPPAVPPPAITPQPPPAPPPKAASAADADTILHEQTGSNKGSNAGGFYTGADGVKRYVKFYDDPSQAYCEHLANNIYNDLGLGAPESVIFDNRGKPAYASVIFDGGKTIKDAGLTEERAKKFMKGFVADVLTGNWDAIGTGFDNAMVLPDGRVVRIDNGGTFLFRAQAGRKPEALLGAISEWDVFFSSKNPYYSQVASKAGVGSPEEMADEVVAGIRAVIALRDAHGGEYGGWRAYVDKAAPGMPLADRQKVVNMLNDRTELLQKKLAELTKPKPPPPKPGEARFVLKQYSTVAPRPGLRLEDLPETEVIDDTYGKIRRSNPDKTTSGEKYADYKKRANESIARISSAAKSGIVSFTGSGYSSIRDSEERGSPDHRSEAIQKAYGVATPEPGTVYRGIHSLPRAVIDKYTSSETFQLGKTGGATSSTSWLIDVSIDSFMEGRYDHPSYAGEKYKILFVLNQKSGIPVETISAVGTDEHEILMKRDAKFRVTGLSRAKGTERILIVEAEEIVDPTGIGGPKAFGGGP